MFGNVALKRDTNDNLSLSKGRSGDRIDGIVAMVMAIGRASMVGAEQPKGSVYETRGVIIL